MALRLNLEKHSSTELIQNRILYLVLFCPSAVLSRPKGNKNSTVVSSCLPKGRSDQSPCPTVSHNLLSGPDHNHAQIPSILGVLPALTKV